MKFIVSGADKKTGRDANLAITATDAEEAMRLAAQKGLLVASVKAVPAQMATDIGTSSLPIWGDDPSDAVAAIVTPTPASPPRATASATPPNVSRAPSGAARPPRIPPATSPSTAPAPAPGPILPTASGITLQDLPAASMTPPDDVPASPRAAAVPTGRDSAIPASARYHVIQNPALYLLEAAVNKHIQEGWEPLGGIQVSYATNQLVFYQALVRGRADGHG